MDRYIQIYSSSVYTDFSLSILSTSTATQNIHLLATCHSFVCIWTLLNSIKYPHFRRRGRRKASDDEGQALWRNQHFAERFGKIPLFFFFFFLFLMDTHYGFMVKLSRVWCFPTIFNGVLMFDATVLIWLCGGGFRL